MAVDPDGFEDALHCRLDECGLISIAMLAGIAPSRIEPVYERLWADAASLQEIFDILFEKAADRFVGDDLSVIAMMGNAVLDHLERMIEKMGNFLEQRLRPKLKVQGFSIFVYGHP